MFPRPSKGEKVFFFRGRLKNRTECLKAKQKACPSNQRKMKYDRLDSR
jgi:hypothetical protein